MADDDDAGETPEVPLAVLAAARLDPQAGAAVGSVVGASLAIGRGDARGLSSTRNDASLVPAARRGGLRGAGRVKCLRRLPVVRPTRARGS